MRVIKKLARYLLISLLILIVAFPLWIKAVPNKYLSLLTGKVGVVDQLVCNFSTKVGGESMSPLIVPGSVVELNRCFEKEDLTEGTVVLFNDGSNLKFGIIRHILLLDPVVYKISDEKAPELLHDVIKEEIAGIAKNIDVSKSKYQAKQETESFILEADEFLTDLYLARIPKGAGIETATLEKTASFSRQEDKFCMVIVPKISLTAVDIEVLDTKKKSTTFLGSGIVFGVKPVPNINCQEFGSGAGMLNLEPGAYRYRFLMNHQVLVDIPFEVR